jgi:hypothetical protein
MGEYATLREKLPSLRVTSTVLKEIAKLLEELSRETITREVLNWCSEYQKEDPDEVITYYEHAKGRYGVKITIIYKRGKVSSYSTFNSYEELENFCKNNKILQKDVEAIELASYLIERNVEVRLHKEEFGSEVYIRAADPNWVTDLYDKIRKIIKKQITFYYIFHSLLFTIGMPFVLLISMGITIFLLTKSALPFFALMIIFPLFATGIRKLVLIYLPYTVFSFTQFFTQPPKKEELKKKGAKKMVDSRN